MSHQGLFTDTNDFPLFIELNFGKLITYFEEHLQDNDRKLQDLLDRYHNHPRFKVIREGITKPNDIIEYEKEIGELMDSLFPAALQSNEIKTTSIPFTNILFHKSKRFQKIIDDAGPDHVLEIKNLDHDNAYIFGCSLILMFHYGYLIDFKRPFYYDIPDAQGIMKNYRIVMNGDFMDIFPTERSIPITDEDVSQLIDNYDNVDIWKEKFPPQSYIFKGFGLTNMFDVTLDVTLSNIKTNLIKRTDQGFLDLQNNIRILFGQQAIDLGLTRYDSSKGIFESVPNPEVKSILLGDMQTSHEDDAFCNQLKDAILVNKSVFAISDVEKYGNKTKQNQFYRHLADRGYKSYLCAPLMDGNRILAIMELGSSVNQFLNSINAKKLEDVVPILSVVVKHSEEDHKNMLEVIIQEECTSIHPAVAWKFEEEAERFFRSKMEGKETSFKEIVFEDVYPLYGQCDIRGSSDARNIAVKNDLLIQLNAAEKIIHQARKNNDLLIYKELVYRLAEYKRDLEVGLAAGTDQQILEFLGADVYPVFSYLKNEDANLKAAIEEYMGMLNADLKMVYEHRKNYDETVMSINKLLANYLDLKAAEAQKMFPHFFERYKTDGVEFNMYIGQSLVKNKNFDTIYLHNLKLWQLTTMCELENQFHQLKPELKTNVEIASLILAYSSPLSIRFRMDEKQFDVDGAYNARYEIVKKRIDKAYIKGTTERLTQPGKLSIVYSHQSERLEYDKYAKYLAALGYIKDEVEYHILEDLQGITGLRAMRFTINYDVRQSTVVTKTKSASRGVEI